VQIIEGTGRRVAALGVVACALSGVLVTLGATTVHADQASIEVAVAPAWKGTTAVGAWIPLQVTVHNKGQEFRGRIEVSAPAPVGNGGGPRCFSMPNGGTSCTTYLGPRGAVGNAGTVTYAVPVVLAAGVTKTLTLTVLPSGTSVHTAVVGDDGGVATTLDTDLDVSFASDRAVIGVVSSDSGALDAMGAVRLPGSAQVQVVHVPAATLPENTAPLSGFDVLVLDRVSTDTLTAAQVHSLEGYVAGGGSLLLVAGDATAKATLAGLPADLLPATPAGGSTRVSLATLSAEMGVGAPSAPVTAQAVRAKGTVALRDGGTPILVTGHLGAGQTALLSVDPGAEPLASWSGTGTLLRELVVRTTHAVGSNGSARYASGGTVGNGQSARAQLANETGNMAGAVSLVPGVTLPAALALGLLAVAYVVLVGPVSYVVLTRLRRRDLFWVTVPVLAIGTTWVAYATGLGASGRGLTLSEVRLVHLTANGDRATVDSFTAAFSPQGGGYQLILPGTSMVSGLPASNDPGEVRVAPTGDQVVAQFQSAAAALRGYSATRDAQLGGRIDASLHDDGQTVSGTVTNHLGVDLSDVQVLTAGGASTSIGELRNGQTTSLSVSHTIASINGGSSCCGPGFSIGGFSGATTGDATAYRRSQLLQALNDIGSGMQTPVLVGLARSPLLDNDVSGSNVDVSVLDAVMVPLSGDAATTASLRSLPATPVDTTDAASTGSYAPAAQGESVYELSLPGGRAWTNLSMHVAMNGCSGFCKGGIAFPGAARIVPVPAPGGSSSGGVQVVPMPASPVLPAPTPRPATGAAYPGGGGFSVQAFDVHALRWVEIQSQQFGSVDFAVSDVSRFVDDDGNLMVRVIGASSAAVTLSADPARAS
jgi:hypothetical protein